MTYLLDVNMLVALFDPQHVNHEAAHTWFALKAIDSWATCPITENGFTRVISNPAYPTVMATPVEALNHLGAFCSEKGHEFWKDEVSLLNTIDDQLQTRLTGHGQITDYYLAILAQHKNGILATFDGSLTRSLEGTELAQSIETVV